MVASTTQLKRTLSHPQNRSRLFVDQRGKVVLTDAWQRLDLLPRISQRISATRQLSKLNQIGIIDYGVLKGEEPPVERQKATGAIYIHGCPLRCLTCYQPEFFSRKAQFYTNAFSLTELILSLAEQDVASISIVMATYQQAVHRAIRMAKAKGLKLPIVLNYSGQIHTKNLDSLIGDIDLFLPDHKALGAEYRQIHGLSPLYSYHTTLGITHLVQNNQKVLVRHLVIPTLEDPLCDLRRLAKHFEYKARNIQISVLTEFFCQQTNRLISMSEELKSEAEELLRSYGYKFYIQGRHGYDYSV